jgi:tetratricopeptide (TPR) repeat protein
MFRKAFGRHWLIPRLIAIAGVLPSWCLAQETDTPVQEHLLAAQQDQQDGKLDAAVQEYQAVLRLQPDLAEAYVNLGLVYYAQAKFDDSAHALSSAAKLKPGMRGVSLWLGIDDVQLHRPARCGMKGRPTRLYSNWTRPAPDFPTILTCCSPVARPTARQPLNSLRSFLNNLPGQLSLTLSMGLITPRNTSG